jgi:hypothetical protein
MDNVMITPELIKCVRIFLSNVVEYDSYNVICRTISEGDVNETYIEAIKNFNKKTLFFKANKAKKLAVLKDTTPCMELLRLKVLSSLSCLF